MDLEARRERLKTEILALPDDQKEALLLKLEAGLDLEQIGKITGVGRETVKSRLRYATTKLKQVMR